MTVEERLGIEGQSQRERDNEFLAVMATVRHECDEKCAGCPRCARLGRYDQCQRLCEHWTALDEEDFQLSNER
jgi:hypothetical protein